MGDYPLELEQWNRRTWPFLYWICDKVAKDEGEGFKRAIGSSKREVVVLPPKVSVWLNSRLILVFAQFRLHFISADSQTTAEHSEPPTKN